MKEGNYKKYYRSLKQLWTLHNRYDFGNSPDIPSGFSENLIRDLYNLQPSDKKKFDAKDRDGRYYEIKATQSDDGATSISCTSVFHELFWINFIFSDDILEIYRFPYQVFVKTGMLQIGEPTVSESNDVKPSQRKSVKLMTLAEEPEVSLEKLKILEWRWDS